MDTLTISLSVLGGVVLAGLVAHTAWQSRRAGPKRVPSPPLAEPREPVMGGFGEPGVSVPGDDDAVADDDGAATRPSGAAVEHRRRRLGVARLDALVDAVVGLTLDAPISGDLALAHLPAARRAGSKPVLIEGRSAETGEWEPPSVGQRYAEFQAGVQLAGRSGALNEIEYSEFVQKVQAYADAIGAMTDFPDMLDVVARARELDQFASRHDAQLALRLRATGTAWSVAYIQQHVGQHGFVPGVVPGRLVMPSPHIGAPPLLTLTFDSQAALADDPNQAVVNELTLNFDVPQTEAAAEPFALWQRSAEALGASLEASVVDDNGQPLSAAGFDAIGAELGQLYAALDARDLAAGSAAARRLFS